MGRVWIKESTSGLIEKIIINNKGKVCLIKANRTNSPRSLQRRILTFHTYVKLKSWADLTLIKEAQFLLKYEPIPSFKTKSIVK